MVGGGRSVREGEEGRGKEEGKGQVGTLGRRGREKFWEGVGREEEEGRACVVGCFTKTLFSKKNKGIPSRVPLGHI